MLRLERPGLDELADSGPAGTVAIVFDGVVLLLRHWQLSLLQIVPACWIWVMTWNLKNHFLSNRQIPTGIGPALAIGVLLAAQVAYWCNATFAYTMLQGDATDIRSAFREARPHWRLVGGLALLTGALQATIWLLMPYMRVRSFWIALLVMFVVQVYLFIAIPSWLLAIKKSGTRRDHMTRSLTTGVLSGVASAPSSISSTDGASASVKPSISRSFSQLIASRSNRCTCAGALPQFALTTLSLHCRRAAGCARETTPVRREATWAPWGDRSARRGLT